MIDLVCPLILVGVESISKDFNLVAWFNVVEHMQKYMCSLYKRIQSPITVISMDTYMNSECVATAYRMIFVVKADKTNSQC